MADPTTADTTPAPEQAVKPLWAADLDTPRLRIRGVTDADLPDLMVVNGDPEVTRFLPYAAWSTPEDGFSWLNRMRALQTAGTALQWVLQNKADARVIGTVLLFKLDLPSARLELGYALGRVHWGQGLMNEALCAVVGHCFGTAGIRRIEAEVNPDNAASCHLLTTLGFVLEGRARQRWFAKGQAYDTHLYGLLATEWAQREPRTPAQGALSGALRAGAPSHTLQSMHIERLYTRAPQGGALIEHTSVQVVAGSGIAGDRYFDARDEPGQNITFVEAEEIEAFFADNGRAPDYAVTGRNVVTRGLRLNGLVGREFAVGGLRFLGVEQCEPCLGLGEALATEGLSPAQAVRRWVGRGGLRADALTGGVLMVGATIESVFQTS